MTVLRHIQGRVSGRSLPQIALGAIGWSPAQTDLLTIGLWYAWKTAFGRAAA